MNAAVIAFVGGLLLVACVAAGVMLYASRKGDTSASRLGFWVVLGIIVILVGMIATKFLSGWFGGIED